MSTFPHFNNDEDNRPSISSKAKTKRKARRSSLVGVGSGGGHDDGTVSSKQSASTAKSDSTKTTDRSRKSKSKDTESSFAAFEQDSNEVFGGDTFFQDASFSNFASTEASFAKPTSTTANDSSTLFKDFNEGVFDAFDQTPVFSKPAEPEWEKSPHTDVPPMKIEPQPPVLGTRNRLQRAYLTDPVHDTSSGNILLATEKSDSSIWIDSVDATSYTLRSSFPMLTSELRQRVSTKYKSTLTKIHKIWCMTTGSDQVAILLDAKTLGSSSLRLVVGYHIPTGRVDYVLTPPSGGDFVYNIGTLAIAKKLIFLAGASPKGACVFLCRPGLRESWSANFLSGANVQVTSLSASAHQPWLVIGLSDQSATVWMYNNSTTSKRWLLPLCRLDRTPVQEAKVVPIPGVENETKKVAEVGFVTHFCWYQPNSTSLPFLAVAFENAIAVYSIQLPVVAAGGGFRPLPEPTPTTVVASTPTLEPICSLRFGSASTILQCAWLSYDHVLVMSQPSGNVMVFEIQWGLYQPLKLRSTIPINMLTYNASILPRSLMHCNNAVCCVNNGEICQLELVSKQQPVERPVCSVPAGLDSLGDPLFTDASSDADGVLHVVCNAYCDRIKRSDDLFYWSVPSKRFWLCRTTVGETKESHVAEDAKQGFSDEVAGGVTSEILCELTQYGEPTSIVRCLGHAVCVVSFHGKDEMALADFENESAIVCKSVKGRSLAFFPRSEEVSGLVLGTTGSELTYFQWTKQEFKFSTSYRPIVGVDTDEDYVECHRIDIFAAGTIKVSLAACGRRLRDGRECIISGDPCDLSDLNPNDWSKALANIATGRSFWLRDDESVCSFIGLQGDGNGYRNFALATSSRVLALTSAFTVAAERQCPTAYCSLAPLGSFVMCYATQGCVRYLSCIDEDFAEEESGNIATLPHSDLILLAVRPDRVILFPNNKGLSFNSCNSGSSPDNFRLPMAILRPALLLEPLVANSVCAGGHDAPNPFLRKVVEKFGRMKVALAHGENEGIGNIGVGLSPKVFSMLAESKLDHAALWLLTGTNKFERSSNTRILPPWLPMGPKSTGSTNADGALHVFSYGDAYLADYVKSSEPEALSALPRRTDPTATFCRDFAAASLQQGNSHDTVKLLDLSGSDSADMRILQLALHESGQRKRHLAVLQSISGQDGKTTPRHSQNSVAASLSFVATLDNHATTDHLDSSIEALALSQRFQTSRRSRQKIIRDQVVQSTFPAKALGDDSEWNLPCQEAKHIWNEGPKKRKENLLMLDRIGDWLGLCRPLILGSEGADAAADRGTKTLADILNKADDGFAAEPDDLESVKEDGWLDGIGEGRTDEANLSAYFRMSDGEDEENSWKSAGLTDISPYGNKALIAGDPGHFSLQPSTSGVDEGEPGKVKSLYDLVFDRSGVGTGSGLSIPAKRGGSLDIGLLHGETSSTRKKCSIEFWYYLPAVEEAAREMVLVRRTVGASAHILSKICDASNKSCVLWELLMLKNGELEFRSCSGNSLKSSQNVEPESAGETKEEEAAPFHLASIGRWNHVCVTFNSKGLDITESDVSIYMKGKEVASLRVQFLPPGLMTQDVEDTAKLNDAMQKSHLVFGLGHRAGFRMTEIRVWACERSADDISSFMYEYLTAAEQKKKFKVKIASKNKKGPLLGKGLGLAQPKSTLKSDSSRPQIGSLAPKQTINLSLAPPPMKLSKKVSSRLLPESTERQAKNAFESNGTFGTAVTSSIVEGDDEENNSVESESLWDTALPLSQQLRPSAASALVRGPPATRHYGGNRGGLPDFSGLERFGVGGIGICGSEKTVVFRDNEDPPAATYPIGASGAVVSDQMDDEGSEFLCCFMAKEGRMVVFELRSRTVVVELQMTTKLNFWRYLPPEAAMNTLCFMLVTPVGGFHWMPLEETPRPHQVWKRGPELQGKKVVNYEEGGSNGLDGSDVLSRVGLVLATGGSSRITLEGWILPITGDSKARQVSDDMLGACLCQPMSEDDGPFLPWLVTAHLIENAVWVNVLTIAEPKQGSVAVGDVRATQMIDGTEVDGVDFNPPALAMGTFPEAICVSLSNIVVVILRRQGLVVAFELEEEDLNLIAQECVEHYVIDAVMRYSAEVGGAEIVMLLADDTNPKDGRIVSFCFRSTS